MSSVTPSTYPCVCQNCNQALPFRRPARREPQLNWVCCGCGTHYQAVLDLDAPSIIFRNVRPDESPVPSPEAAGPSNG